MSRRQFGLPASVVLVATALIALIWILVRSQTQVERDQAMQAATERTTNLAVAFEQYTIRTLETAESIIRYVDREFERDGYAMDLEHLIRDVGVNRDAFDAIGLVNAAGDVVRSASPTPLAAPVNIADREHFAVHRSANSPAVFIGRPVVSRRSGEMMVPVTSRLNTRTGAFAGVVSVQFRPERFIQFYESATLHPSDVLSLIGRDGITRARQVGDKSSTGEDISGGLLFRELATRDAGAYIGPGRLDGIERLYSFRAVAGYPLIATVGVAVTDIYAEVSGRATWYRRSAAVLSSVIAISAVLLIVALTRRRQTFEQLLASTSRLQALFEHSNDAIILADDQARCLDANPAACVLLGMTRQEALGRTVRDVSAVWNEDAAREAWRVFLETGQASGEYRLCRRDDTEVDVEFSAVAHIEPGVHLTVLRDVTERKALQRQSLRAQRMESLGTLAGGIAHDLNNALAPILMSIGLLKDDESDKERLEILDTIEQSAQRGADMVRQVLSFARGVEGQRVDVSLSTIVREIQKIANDTFLKHIQIAVTLPTDLWNVQGDPTQIHQVLLNLCVNARDVMPNGGTLTLSAANRIIDETFAASSVDARPGPYVCLTVTDTGPGIPPDVIDRIFEPFFTTKAFGHGTGLGLSTSLAIVKSHGGFIRLKTDANGTAFSVYLPAAGAAAAIPDTRTPDPLPRGQGELILVIDDEPAVREVTRRTLEMHGYLVLVAVDGAEGVATFAAHQADIAVVITDMMMPLMDGPATMAALRWMRKDVRIIAASGLPEDARIARAGESGAAFFLPKPFTAETLLTILRQALDTR
jgi:PAS domain S-box-containing protein